MFNKIKAPIRTTKAATAMRQVVITARKDAASYGEQNGGPRTFLFFSFQPTRLQQIQNEAYIPLVWKLVKERLAALPAYQAAQLVQKYHYWNSTSKERKLIDIRNQYEDLSNRVAEVEKKLGIKI